MPSTCAQATRRMTSSVPASLTMMLEPAQVRAAKITKKKAGDEFDTIWKEIVQEMESDLELSIFTIRYPED